MILDSSGQPVLGNLGLRAEMGAHVKRNVRALLADVLSDQLLHAEILGAGEFRFRAAFAKDMGSFFANHRGPCDILADVVFRFCEVQWRQRYPDLTPKQFLDRVQIASPPTEEEIERAWKLEIGSSEAFMREHYDGSARTRKGADIFRAMNRKH